MGRSLQLQQRPMAHVFWAQTELYCLWQSDESQFSDLRISRLWVIGIGYYRLVHLSRPTGAAAKPWFIMQRTDGGLSAHTPWQKVRQTLRSISLQGRFADVE
jgi:hypothetical protein